MPQLENIACTNCGKVYPDQGVPYCCEKCGGIYDIDFWTDATGSEPSPNSIGIWKYRDRFGIPNLSDITLGEGETPLIWGKVSGKDVAFKCEYLNPTGSFKDRGSAVISSFLKSRGVDEAVEDSSGNAGASLSAYAAHAGIKTHIYVPDSASGPKRKQIEAYGSNIIRVMGPRSNAAQAVKKAALNGAVYASHAYLPFNLPGYATAAYEIVEQLGEVPGTVIVPVGQGGFFLGIGRGFLAMYQKGIIPKMPIMVAVQARMCSPLWALHAYGAAGLNLVSEGQTVAEGIRVDYPLRGDVIINFINQYSGQVAAVDEDKILAGRDQLALQGFYVEATSGVIWDAIVQLKDNLVNPVIAVLTGSGLKSPF